MTLAVPTGNPTAHDLAFAEGEAAGTPLGIALAAALASMADAPSREWHVPAVKLEHVAAYLRFSTAGYSRIPLLVAPQGEVYLMGWLPGQQSIVHDHGASRGLVLVLSGNGRDESFRLEGERVLPAGETTFRTGHTLFEAPGDVHRVSNPGPELLVTLHFYAPRLAEMGTYEVRR